MDEEREHIYKLSNFVKLSKMPVGSVEIVLLLKLLQPNKEVFRKVGSTRRKSYVYIRNFYVEATNEFIGEGRRQRRERESNGRTRG